MAFAYPKGLPDAGHRSPTLVFLREMYDSVESHGRAPLEAAQLECAESAAVFVFTRGLV